MSIHMYMYAHMQASAESAECCGIDHERSANSVLRQFRTIGSHSDNRLIKKYQQIDFIWRRILSIVSVKHSMSIDSRNQIEYLLTFYIRKLAIEIEEDLHNTDSKNKRFCCFLGIKIVTLSVWKNFLKWHLISFYFEEII